MKKIAIALCCLSLAGCMPHLKEMDSFATNKEDSYSFPDGMKPMPEAGDPYTFSGIAGGSGGTIARQSYATDNNAPDFRDATGTGVTGEFDKDRTQTADPISGNALPGAGLQFNGESGTSRERTPLDAPLSNPTYPPNTAVPDGTRGTSGTHVVNGGTDMTRVRLSHPTGDTRFRSQDGWRTVQ